MSLFSIVFVIALIFIACKKNEDSGDKNKGSLVIDAKNVLNGNSDIVTVTAELWNENANNFHIFATSEYKNDGFKLNLSADIPDECLYSIDDELDFPTEIVSDTNTQVSTIRLYAYNNEEECIGNFYLSDELGKVKITFIYADRNFTVKGTDTTFTYPKIYDCSFKKGWNILYSMERRKDYLCTTQKPTEVSLRWYYHKIKEILKNKNYVK